MCRRVSRADATRSTALSGHVTQMLASYGNKVVNPAMNRQVRRGHGKCRR